MNALNITSCLLDNSNSHPAAESTISALLTKQNKIYLWNDRPCTVDTIVLHYISAIDFAPQAPFDLAHILGIFCTVGVSSHYLILRNGDVLRLAPEDKRAWHCGGSIMPAPDNRTNVNDFSIGIELVSTPASEFTNEQYDSLSQLCIDIEQRYNRQFTIVGHENIAGARAVEAGLRTDIKKDPGGLFDWSRFTELIDCKVV